MIQRKRAHHEMRPVEIVQVPLMRSVPIAQMDILLR